jgi:putative membrane protein
MQWWCSAVGVPWSWTWRPYPGVWLFVLGILLTWIWLVRRSHEARPARRWPYFAAGLLLLWIALDWPVGALGGGYLASLHMVQFILIGMAAPPLLLLGLPSDAVRASGSGLPGRAGRLVSHPLIALILFNAVVIATHMPRVTDRLMPTQAGSFLIDVLWLAGGLLYWWPLLAPHPRAWFRAPVRIAYLFASMVFMTAPGAMITFSELPIYATYELAPPIPGVTPLEDQRLAGILMRLGASTVVILAISIVFLRWNRAEVRDMEIEQRDAALRSGSER